MSKDMDAARKVIGYIRERPGLELHVRDISGATGTIEKTTSTILARTARQDGPVERRGRGTYVYLAAPDPALNGAKELPPGYTTQTVGNSSQGPVAAGEDGVLWLLRRL